MSVKAVIQGLAVVWVVLFVASFVSMQMAGSDGDPQSGLARVTAFLTWQLIAFVVAALAAFATRYAIARGAARVKVVGYLPLALSVFLVGSFIAIMAVRFYAVPFFEALGFF
jgi:hypothetical protein